MMTHEARVEHEGHEGRSPADRPGRPRWLPAASGGIAVAALLAHFAGGGLVLHVGLPALLVSLGLNADFASLGGGTVAVGAVAIAVKLLLGFGATRMAGGTGMLERKSGPHSDITIRKTIHGARSHDRRVARLTLGRGGTLRERT